MIRALARRCIQFPQELADAANAETKNVAQESFLRSTTFHIDRGSLQGHTECTCATSVATTACAQDYARHESGR